MHKGCNPNREQKELLVKNKKNWKDWLYITQVATSLTFRHKEIGDTIELTIKNR